MNKINLISLQILVSHYQMLLKPLKGKVFEQEAEVQIDLAEMIAGSTHNGPDDWVLLGEFAAMAIILGTAYADDFEHIFHDIYPGISLRSLDGMRHLRDFSLTLNGEPDYIIVESDGLSKICHRQDDADKKVTPYEIHQLIQTRLSDGPLSLAVNDVDKSMS